MKDGVYTRRTLKMKREREVDKNRERKGGDREKGSGGIFIAHLTHMSK